MDGQGIPAHITGLPAEFLSTPIGQMLRPMIDQVLRPAPPPTIRYHEAFGAYLVLTAAVLSSSLR